MARARACVQSLRTHPRDKKVLAAALGALTQLATIDAEALKAIRREGALEATIAALKFFHVDAPIQRHGECSRRLQTAAREAGLQLPPSAGCSDSPPLASHLTLCIPAAGLSFIVNTLADSHCRQVAFALGLADVAARALRCVCARACVCLCARACVPACPHLLPSSLQLLLTARIEHQSNVN